MKLGMTMYSFNRYARQGKIDVPGFIRWAADAGLESVDLLAYYWKNESDEPEEARALIDDLGLELAAYAVGNNFVQADKAKFQAQVDVVRRGIEMAHRLGAPVMRIFGGHAPDMPQPDAFKLAAEGIALVVDEAEDAGVVLAVENHGGVPGTSEEVVELLQEIDSPWVRACVDVGNFITANDDPLEAVSRTVGYAVHVHVKDMKRIEEEDGKISWQRCTPGQGDIDYPTVLRLLARNNYAGSLAIEAEGPEDDMSQCTFAVNWLRWLLEEIRHSQ
jgi:sugar phosphate isomerase/epimerase